MPPARHEPALEARERGRKSAQRALCASYRKMHFPSPPSPRDARISKSGEGARETTDVGWTTRMKCGTTAAPQHADHPHSVRSDAGSTLAGLECLQADLCRPLGAVSTRPSALSNGVLRGSGGEDARLWQSRDDGLCRVPLLALWPGQAPGGDELQIISVLAVRQSLRRQLGQPSKQGPPRGRDLSAHHPDGPGDVPHDFLPECRGRVERADALWGAVPG